MTENEIIECLKENKTKGIAYLFLPEEVSSWISEHLAEPAIPIKIRFWRISK